MQTRLANFEQRLFRVGPVAVGCSVLVAGYAALMLAGLFGHAWMTTESGQGRGRDFVAIWSAGRLALDGAAASAYDPATLSGVETTVSDAPAGAYPWIYPPSYFLLAAPLALLPYVTSTLVWIVATLTFYAAAIYAIVPRAVTILAALACPFVVWTLFLAQNSLFIAGMIALILVNLDRWPILAGLLLGLLTLKPHLGVLFPLVLILTGRWRCFSAAAVTTSVLVAVSLLLFGADPWRAWLAALPNRSGIYLASGTIPWNQMDSAYALVRSLGGDPSVAWAVHAAAVLGVVALVCWIWRRPAPYDLKAAALAAGALSVTPYLLVYDLMVLAVATAFLVRYAQKSGYLPGERLLLAGLVILLLGLYAAPVGFPLIVILLMLTTLHLRNARVPPT